MQCTAVDTDRPQEEGGAWGVLIVGWALCIAPLQETAWNAYALATGEVLITWEPDYLPVMLQ